MGDHTAQPAQAPTQAAYPWRAATRTALATGLPAFVAALWLLPLIIQEIVDGFGQHLPEGLRLWLVGAAAVITAAATVITRIMALPGVLAFTDKYLPWLAPDKK